MGRFLFDSGKSGHLRACFKPPTTGAIPMNTTVKSYLYFLAFLAVTKMVVKPLATSMNIPLVKDIV